jgi:hypothetical protein
MPRKSSTICTERVLGMWLVLLLSAWGLALIARSLQGGSVQGLIAFGLGLVATPLLASPIEWMIHRYVYHRPGLALLRRIHVVHVAHHNLYFPTWRYVTAGPARRIPVVGGDVSEVCTSTVGNAMVRTVHFLFYFVGLLALICLPGWLLSSSLPFLYGTLFGTAVISHLFITVHDAIHRPHSHRLLQKQFWFEFLDEHHYIHHVDEECNVNFLLPLADLLFGTLRTSLNDAELAKHGPRTAAKGRVQGLGGRARRQTSSALPPGAKAA